MEESKKIGYENYHIYRWFEINIKIRWMTSSRNFMGQTQTRIVVAYKIILYPSIFQADVSSIQGSLKYLEM